MSNLKSEKIFSRLHSQLASTLKAFNYGTFTNIQQEALPSVLSSNSLFIQAPTGTGKTLCYVIPILDRLFKTNKAFCGLIVLPTKELSTQVYSVFKKFVPEKHFKVSIINGFSSLSDEIKELKKKPRVIIGTPGRIAQHISTSHLDLPNIKLKYLIFDESDLLFHNNFKSEINTILEKCAYLYKKENKTCFISLSATCSENMIEVISKYNLKIKTAFSDTENNTENVKEENKIKILNTNNKFTNIKERMFFTPKHKLNALILYILQSSNIGVHKQESNIKTIVFFNSIEKAKIFFKFLETVKNDFKLTIPYLTILTGDMDSKERQIYLKKFKGVLISTDIASRGLDVENVDLVINYDVPKTEKTYTHRIGRTGRAGKTGTAITFVNEHNIKQFVKMEEKLERKIKEINNEEFGKMKKVDKDGKVYKKLKIEESVLNASYLNSRAILRENKKI